MRVPIGRRNWGPLLNADLDQIEASFVELQAAVEAFTDTLTTKGDLLVRDADGTLDRLPAGTDGNVLGADSTQARGLRWNTSSEVVARALGWRLPSDVGVLGDGENFQAGSEGAAAIAAGTPTLTAFVSFTSADVGKLVAIHGAGAAGGTLVTTIAAVVDSDTVTLANNAATTVAAAEWSYASDDSEALQDWLDATVRGRGMTGWLPPNKMYGFTEQLIIPAPAHVIGGGSDYGQRFNSPQGGSELAWFGPSGTDAIVTSVNADSDWSKGYISGLRITNKARSNTAGSGLVVRNPQNTALVYDVCISDFPDQQLYVVETKTTGTLGASPGCAFFDKLFLIGGKRQLRIEAGAQPLEFSRGACDTTAATLTESVLIEDGATASTARANPILFRSWKVELADTTTTDIIPWNVGTQNPIHWDSCQAQDNRASVAAGTLNTKGVIEWTNATKKWPRCVVTNMSAKGFSYGFRALSCGFNLPNPSGAGATAAWAFGFDWSRGDLLNVAFSRDTLTASMSGTSMPLVGTSATANPSGFLLPFPAVLVAITITHSADLTAGSLTVQALKNGSTVAAQLGVSTTGDVRRRHTDLLHPDIGTGSGIVAAADQVFAAGDRISCAVTTSGTLAPTGGTIWANLLFRVFYPGD